MRPCGLDRPYTQAVETVAEPLINIDPEILGGEPVLGHTSASEDLDPFSTASNWWLPREYADSPGARV